jgi:hypothetical protein
MDHQRADAMRRLQSHDTGRPPSMSRNSTARTSPARSPQNDRTAARLSDPEFTVTTRKIAARVSGANTACATVFAQLATSGSQFGS